MSERVYLLEHSYEKDGFENTKYLGIYSQRKTLQEAIELYTRLPGFRDWPDNFCEKNLFWIKWNGQMVL